MIIVNISAKKAFSSKSMSIIRLIGTVKVLIGVLCIPGGFVMKFNQLLLMLLAILGAATVVSAQQPSVDQLKQIMEKSFRESHNIYLF